MAMRMDQIRQDVDSAYATYLDRHYLPELDGIRGLAVMLVISYHLKDPMASWLGGSLGVTIFFVLSGYLITRLGLAEERTRGALNLPSFFVRRVFRLMPLYYLILALYCVVYFAFGWSPAKREPLARALPYYLTYFQECALFRDMGTRLGVPFVHTWSLGIEEKYYLVWPFLAFVAWHGRGPIRIFGTLALTLALGSAPLLIGEDKGRFVFSYSLILVGCFAALLLDDRWWFERVRWVGSTAARWAILGLFLAAHYAHRHFPSDHDNPYELFYASMTAMALASILLGGGALPRLLGQRALVTVGRLSYAMYLIHGFGLNLAEKFAPPYSGSHLGSFATLTLAISISIGLALVLSWTIERPGIRMGRRLSERLRRRDDERLGIRPSIAPSIPMAISVESKA